MHNSQLELEKRIAALEAQVGLGSEPADDLLSLLDNPVAEIKKVLPDYSVEALHKLRPAEVDGNTRSSLLKAIDSEIESQSGE